MVINASATKFASPAMNGRGELPFLLLRLANDKAG
jgi:hypothetical protein